MVSGSFASLCTEVQREVCALGTGVLARLFEETDEALLEDLDHKKRFFVERKRQIKRLQTEMGEVELKRTLFKDKKNGSFRYLADELLDVDKYQRIDKGLKVQCCIFRLIFDTVQFCAPDLQFLQGLLYYIYENTD